MLFDDRPKIKLEKQRLDNVLDYLAFGLVLTGLFYTIINYKKLPEQIPIHFNHSGSVTNYGDKNSVWALHIIGIALVYGIYHINKFPHIFNYPQKITLENAHKFYSDATRMMRFLNVSIALLFALISFEIINIALIHKPEMGTLINYIIIGIIIIMTLGPLIYIFMNLRSKKV